MKRFVVKFADKYADGRREWVSALDKAFVFTDENGAPHYDGYTFAKNHAESFAGDNEADRELCRKLSIPFDEKDPYGASRALVGQFSEGFSEQMTFDLLRGPGKPEVVDYDQELNRGRN